MGHDGNWIDFKWKTPYSCLEGRSLPEDYLVLVVKTGADSYIYEMMHASVATTLYYSFPDKYIAWRYIDLYVPYTPIKERKK